MKNKPWKPLLLLPAFQLGNKTKFLSGVHNNNHL